jgi:hypothetical protein
MSGWLIRITGWESQERVRLFAVAESDPRMALVAVQKVTDAAPKLRVETVGQLSAKTISLLGLQPGQALDLSA